MNRHFYPDKQLAKELAENSLDKESLIAQQQFWKVMDAFKVKLKKYDLEELHTLKDLFISLFQYKSAFKIDVNAVVIGLIDEQIKKLR